jgi:hypothetical protein
MIKLKIRPSFSWISPWLLWSYILNISSCKPFFFTLSWSHHNIIDNMVGLFFKIHLQHLPPIPQVFPFILYGWSSLCKESCYLMLFSSSFYKLTTKVSLDWNSPTLATFNFAFILSSYLHCIFAFVHNHHPMIENATKILSSFSSTSSSATTVSP